MRAGAAALCLDLTRTVRRAGQGPATGIDRVERAWAERVVRDGGFGFVATRLGFLLLDSDGVAAALTSEGPPTKLLAELRGRAIGRRLREGPGWGFAAGLKGAVAYLNAGHAALDRPTLRAARQAFGRVGVILHDTIPLDRPGLCRPGTDERVRRRLDAVGRHADVVVVPCQSTAADVARHLPLAPLVAAPFGVTPPASVRAEAPQGRPTFVAIGTVEPRKNHALLLDVWDALLAERGAADLPSLLILGRRGWAGRDLIARLEARPTGVRWIEGADDAGVAAHLAGARALLFPSLAEGFGFPPLEAASLGVPVVASPLPQVREMLGDWPVYLRPDDGYAWRTAVLDLAAARGNMPPHGNAPVLPEWDEHFRTVLGLLGAPA